MAGRDRQYTTLRVVLYFAFAPDEVLTAADMRDKFADIVPAKQSISGYLRHSLRNGLIRQWDEPGIGQVWGAGPKLRELVRGRIQ